MYLKRLELQGFKSFPDKVRFEFIRGITAVVGPNGSGKSNVADAIKWVLGEQSAKSLRGSKMEDVIFSGTVNRKALGFAEVSLTIDNTDAAMKIEYSEVTISRRVFRSGESEYQINGSFCRLKDIHELLMDTGIGKEGYSLIGQGRIDEILSSRPEDRRYIFEEAAGIVKYKSRKGEAETKLEKEKQNLLRVNDIITEIETRLEPLYMKSENAKKYLELKEKLKLIQINIFLNEANKADEEIKDYTESLSAFNAQIGIRSGILERLKEEIKDLKDEVQVRAEEIHVENENLVNLRMLYEQKENDIRLIAQQMEYISTDIEKLYAAMQLKKNMIQDKQNEIILEKAKKERLESEYEMAFAVISEHEEQFRLINERMSRDEQKISDFNRIIIELNKTYSGTKSEILRLSGDYERLEEKKEGLQDALNLNSSQKKEKSALVDALQETADLISLELNRLEADKLKLNTEKDQLFSKFQSKKSEYMVLNQSIAEAAAKYKILRDLENDYEGYSRSVKAVLMQKAKEPELFAGVFGTVGELLEVPGKYETAIETALGAAVQNIITADEYSAKLAIEHLKQVSAGRATFLPLTAVKPRSGQSLMVLNEKGYLGIASDLVRFSEKYSNVLLNLLGRVVVVDDMDNAVSIFRKYRYELKIVTLDGELLSPGGAMTGGSHSKKGIGIFGRAREIKELSERLEDLNEHEKQMSAELNKLSEILEIINVKIEQNKEIIRTKQSQLMSDTWEIERLRSQITDHERQIAEINEEDVHIMKCLISTNSEIRIYCEKQKAIENEIICEKKNLEDFMNALASERESKDTKMSQLMELKSTIGALRQNICQTIDNVSRLESELKIYESEIIVIQDDIDENTGQKLNKKSEEDEIIKELGLISNKQSALRGKLILLNQEALKQNQKLQDTDDRQRDLLNEISGLNTDKIRVEAKKEQIEKDVRKLYDEMWDNYKITYVAAKNYPHLDMPQTALNREEKRTKAHIAELGDINVSAIEEYENVKERYDFLTEQRDDIVKAEKKLEQVIKELVLRMEEQFIEQFNKISENFDIVYKEMFGGGRAYLKLTNQSSILSSGIEIVSHPPGKNISNISLLSGGEHALTAIALLFGILRLKPSPFCMLDEIEASLDDANVLRFANYLKNFAGESQFIVITHRKGTMEAADVLYGITMQEQGVSKPVSVRFSQEAV